MNDNDRTSVNSDLLEGESSAIDLVALIHTIQKKWWLILGCMIMTLLLGVLYILRTPKTYQSETIIQVEQATTKVMNIQDLTTEDLKTQEVLKTIEQNLVGAQVLQGLIDRMKLTPAQLGLKENPSRPLTPQEYIEALQDSVSAKLKRGTRLISVTAENTDPILAQQLASAIVTEYIRTDAAQKLGVAGEANQFLNDESVRLKKALEDAEEAAQGFKDSHPGVALDDSQNFIDQKLLAISQTVNQSKQTRIKLESDLAQINKFKSTLQGQPQLDAMLTVESVKTDPEVLQIQKTIADEEAAFTSIKQRYLPKHPKYQQQQSRLDGLQSTLDRAVFKAAESVSTSAIAALDSEKRTEELLEAQTKIRLDNDRLAIPYNSLSREVQRNQEMYDAVQQRLKETTITSGMDDNKIRTVTPATLPYLPIKPKPALVLIAAIVGGLLMGLCLCFAFSLADTSLKTLDHAEEALGIPAVGAIPLGNKAQALDHGKSIFQEPHSPLAESFRTLRTALSLLGEKEQHRSFLFTSGVPGEGKSFCSVNYAISLAQLGKKTLLVDADLRLPVLEPLFFKDVREKGLSGLLDGTCTLDEVVYATEIPNLYILPSGKRAQNPAELIGNSAIPKIIANFLTKFERVVIDSAPVHAVSDTLLIVRHVNAVCLVVHAGKTPLKVVARAIQKISEASGKPAGFILNRLPQNSSGYYYHYSSGSYGQGVYGGPEAYANVPKNQSTEEKPVARKKTRKTTSPDPVEATTQDQTAASDVAKTIPPPTQVDELPKAVAESTSSSRLEV